MASSLRICALYSDGMSASVVVFSIPFREATTSSGDILRVSISGASVQIAMTSATSYQSLLQKLLEGHAIFKQLVDTNVQVTLSESANLLIILRDLYSFGAKSAATLTPADGEEGSSSGVEESDSGSEGAEEAGSQEEPPSPSPTVSAKAS